MKSLYIVQRILKYNKKQSLYLLLFRVTFNIDPRTIIILYGNCVYNPPTGGVNGWIYGDTPRKPHCNELIINK